MQTEPKTQPPRLPKPLRITEQVWPEGTVPVVSIHCITYQHGKFIREAIEGFLMQETTFPVEILIHDDASTDGTADIIREYEAKYTQLIKPIYQTENQWSKGNKPDQINLARAKGEFIALCEGDDYWTSPHKLQKQAEILEANPDSFMVGAYSMTLSENGTEKSEGDYVLGPFPVKERYSLKELFRQGFHTSTYLLRAAIVGEFRVFASGCAVTNGDTVLQTLAAAKGDVLLLDEVVSRYRLHSGGVWTGAKPHKNFSRGSVYQRANECSNLPCGDAKQKSDSASKAVCCIRSLRGHGKKRVSSIALSPAHMAYSVALLSLAEPNEQAHYEGGAA
jgi:glycosyltransferase involved in cell wall biosynthesis